MKAEATACLIRLKLVVENQELFLQRDVVALQPLVCLAQPLIPGLAKPNILATKDRSVETTISMYKHYIQWMKS